MICRKCGADNKNANSFCVECGAPFMHENEKLEGYEWKEDESKKYRPTGVFEYIGYDILFMIPVIGLMSLLYLRLGGTESVNLKNYAGAWLCRILIFIVIMGILFLTGTVSPEYLLLF